MEKTIKYLENGEYHYATVKDVGDLAKLKTDSKEDLVAAINDLFDNGGKNAGKPEGYDKLVDNVAGAIQKQQQMTDTITNMQQSAQLSDAEMQHMKQVQEELHQEYLKALKELNEAVDKAKADAAALDKKTNDMQDKIDETFADVNKEVSDIHKQLDAEAKGLHKDLDETKTNLEATRKDLLNSTQEYGQVHSEVKELQDKFSRRVWSTDLDPVREQVSKNSTEVQQTKDELKNKADQSNLDLVTNSVENLSAQVKQNASGLEVAVKRDELGGDVSRLLNDKTNLLLGTRSFSGEDNWKNRDAVTIEPGYYKGLKSVAVQVTDKSIYQPYHVKANTAYTFSFFGKEDKDNPKATLIVKPIDAPNINIDNAEQPVHITTEWQRFAVTFSADQDCDISIQVIQGPEASNNILHLAGFKLQYGQNNTPWEPNEADVAENIEHTESQFNVYSDQIAGIVKKQEKMGDTERQLDTRITETAKGLEQTSKDLQDANGKITEFKGQLESTARGLKTEYEKYTNDAIGQISDSSLNLIHNSAFQNKDDNFAQWQNVSAKANVREDDNGLRWVELTQSGMTTDNPQGITSNYFVIKQGKVTVAVDIKLGDKANLDNQNILLLELYDENKKRVDFTDVSVSQLGLSMSVLNDHNVHRGLYRLGIDRKDVKYMTVKAILHRNGDLWLTNFSARLSSIDDGGYTPNPDDLNQQILKMNTKIEEDAEHIALKANSVDVTRDIKSAVDDIQVGGRNLLRNSDKDISVTSHTTDGYPAWANIDTGYSFEHGKTYTFSTEARNSTDKITEASIRVFESSTNTQVGIYALPADGKRHSVTFTVPNDSHDYHLLLYAGHAGIVPGVTVTTTYHHPKLELGNMATDWTPAPEDVDSKFQYKEVTGSIDFNDLKTQQKIFYKDVHAQNAPAGSNYWYFVDVDVKQDGARIIQTATSDRDNITWKRTYRDNSWTTWQKQATQGDIDTASDGLRQEIKSAKDAAIKVASDQIDIHVNELTTSFDDKLNKRVNEVKTASEKFTSDGIEQTVRKITDVKNQVDGVNDKVNNLKVGGRNIALNTDRDIVINDTGNTGAQGWCFATIPLAQQPKIGDQVTVSAEGTLTGKGNLGTYDVILYNSTKSNARSNSKRLSSGKRASATLQVNNLDGNGDTVLLIYAGNISDTEGKKNTVHHLKVEFGNVATDWTPAPEDVDSKFQYKEVTGVIDFNDLKTQQKVFYKDTQARNSPVGGNYWYFLDVDVEPGSARIIQTATSDRNNITWKRTFAVSWSPWVKQADQRNVDDLNNQISSFKTETTASVKNLGDRVTTQVNSVETRVINVNDKLNNLSVGGRNLLLDTDLMSSQYWTANSQPAYYRDRRALGKYNASLDTSSSSYISFNYKPKIIFDTSKEYTFSAYVCSLQKGQSLSLWLNPDNTYKNSFQNATITNTSGDIDWQRLSVTFTPKRPEVYLSFGASNITTGQTVWVSSLMLEEGNIATDYTHAPEDTIEAIKEINTKWDVANGQIQGKVTATDVNNILNGKGYATQSWAQTMFTMKSDAITLQAVRDNITNGIQNQVNDTRNQVKGLQNQFNTQTGINLLKGTADFSGPWFNKNGKGWSYSEWQPPTSENKSERNNNVVYQDSGHAWDGLGQTVELDTGEYTFSMWMWPTLSGNESMNIYAGDSQYGGTAKVNFSGYCYSASQPQNRWILVKTYLTVTQGGKLSIRPELNQASGTIYVASYMLQHGHVENPVWAPAPDDLAPKSIISSINITPDQIKIASNKIEIDGNTYIHGDLQAQDVRLVGKRGAMDLSGDKGLLLSNNDGSEVAINENGLGLKYKNDFSMDINSSLLTLSKRNAALDQPEPIAFGNIGSVMKGHDPKVNGFMLRYNPGALNDLKKRGATFMSFGYNTPDIGNVVSQIELYGQDTEINVQDSGKTTKRTQRKGIHIQDALEFDTNTSVRFPQAHDHLFLHSEKWDISQQAGYYQPSIRLVSDGGSLGNAGVTFQWDAIKPFGAVDMTDARLWVYGVDHGIKNVWVSWSNWDGGERYPALVNDIGYWGGIAFPKSGRVTLFDADGRYYTPDRNTGIGAYNNYIGKNNNWH